MRNERQRRDANRRTWRLIAATGLFSLALTLATGWALRATAQQQPAPPAGAPAADTPPPAPPADEAAGPEGDALPEEAGRRAPRPVVEEPPELRESADNNLSFPVDI
jgi:hypothetical protein